MLRFNRRHAGRSILTYPRSLSRMLIKCYVSIDGTLADQFLLSDAKLTKMQRVLEFQSTARWQINSYFGSKKLKPWNFQGGFQSTARWQINSYRTDKTRSV